MRSVFTKIFSVYFLTTVLLMFVILYFSFNTIKRNTINNISRHLDNLNKTTLVQTHSYIASQNYYALDSLIKILGRKSGTRLTIILPDGTVVADSRTDPLKMENHADRPEIIDAIKSGKGQSIRFSYTLNEQMLYEAIAVKEKGKIIAVSRNSMPITYLNNLYYDIIGNIIIFTAVVFIISLLILYFFSRNFSNNIKELVTTTNRIAQGDFNSKVYLNTKDELSVLAQNLNDMSDKLKENFEEINEQKKEISSIIKSIRDAIVVIDSNDRITFYNKNFKRYFNLKDKDIGESYYWELLLSTGLQKLIKKIQSSKKNKSAEIEIGGKYYLASGSRNVVNNDIIIIFYDITEYKQLEQVKKDFISNVSHELKTPLTAIKGFVETLQEQSDENNKRYLKIIERQTQRLINIVQDLLLLSKLENPETQLIRRDVDAVRLLENIKDMFSQKADEKGIELSLKAEPGTYVFADEFMLEQVLINLIENALNHTSEGFVRVDIQSKKSHSIITVSDSGKGIPKEHHSRIFERFYTVEPSHSRSISGTGLGLSIVKHIINLHKGDLELESTPGKGTTFTIRL